MRLAGSIIMDINEEYVTGRKYINRGNQAIYGQDKRKQKQLINTILTVEQGIIQNILCTLAGVVD